MPIFRETGYCHQLIVDIFSIFQVDDSNDEVEAESKDWICKRCTLENPGQVSICQACGGSKLKSLENGTLKKGEYWACSKCTLKNPLRSSQCRACEQHRKLPKWFKCSVCTYENGPGRKTCEMCDSNLKEARMKTPIPTLLESRPGSTTSMGSRHESELMEQLRKVEESAARDKWRNIVQFCKEVRLFPLLAASCSKTLILIIIVMW